MLAGAAPVAGGPAVPGRNFIRSPTTLKDKIQYFKELVFAYMVIIDKILNDQVMLLIFLMLCLSLNGFILIGLGID